MSERENFTSRLAQSYAQACAGSSTEKLNEIHDFVLSAKRDLHRNMHEQTDDPLGKPMTIQEIAALIGCSVWTVRQRHLRRGLPYFRIGESGKLVFYRKQVIQWILENQKSERS